MYDEYIIEKRLEKGRHTLNVATGLGIRKSGLSVATFNMLYWSVVIPTYIYGCETWILSYRDVEQFGCFQGYAGRKVQRFPARSPNDTCCLGIGWLSIVRYIYVRKLIFVCTIWAMDDDEPVKKVFLLKYDMFKNRCMDAETSFSPTFEILRVAVTFYGFISSKVLPP